MTGIRGQAWILDQAGGLSRWFMYRARWMGRQEARVMMAVFTANCQVSMNCQSKYVGRRTMETRYEAMELQDRIY